MVLMAGKASSHRHPNWPLGQVTSNDAKECDVKKEKRCVLLAAFLVEIEATLIG